MNTNFQIIMFYFLNKYMISAFTNLISSFLISYLQTDITPLKNYFYTFKKVKLETAETLSKIIYQIFYFFKQKLPKFIYQIPYSFDSTLQNFYNSSMGLSSVNGDGIKLHITRSISLYQGKII